MTQTQAQSYPVLTDGMIFSYAPGAHPFQRLEVPTRDVRVGDTIAGLTVKGVSTSQHDNKAATRFELEGIWSTDPDDSLIKRGRLIVQDNASLTIERMFDPEDQEVSAEIDVAPVDGEYDQPDELWLMNYLFGLVAGTRVKPKVLSLHGPGGGNPNVLLTGPRRDLRDVLERYDPDDNGGQLEALKTDAAAQAKASTLMDWQRERIDALMPEPTVWTASRMQLPAGVQPQKTIFNQDVRDGWMLSSGSSNLFVGRELMAVLMQQYPDRLDIPVGFQP